MMIEIIGNILKKIKVGAQYKSLIKQKTNKYVQDDCDLTMGAKKISYIAQSTFHTIKQQLQPVNYLDTNKKGQELILSCPFLYNERW